MIKLARFAASRLSSRNRLLHIVLPSRLVFNPPAYFSLYTCFEKNPPSSFLYFSSSVTMPAKKRQAETAVEDQDGDDALVEAPPAKKGRGRPKKAGSAPAKKAGPVKNGRGRKPTKKAPARKKAVSEDDEDDDEEEEEIDYVSNDDDDDEYTPTKGARGTKRNSDTESEEEYNPKPTKRPRGRPKRAKDSEEEDEYKPKKKAPQKKAAAAKAKKPPPQKKSASATDWESLDFSSSATTKDGRAWNLKFSSWNVNGIRAWLNNNALDYIQKEDPDIFCVQETKCSEEELPKELSIEGYTQYWSSAEQKGYSGTGLFCKEKPINVTYGIGSEEHDKEGRVITAEFEKYYFITAYVPNAGEKLKRLDYRIKKWNPDFREYLKTLDEKKPVILCGDLNVAHHEIDLANPKSNQKTSGFTPEERADFTELLEKNKLVDTFRHLYPDRKDAYSYWSYRSNARANNKGWRLDYFLVSERFVENVCDNIIRPDVYGSDHCPIVLLLSL